MNNASDTCGVMPAPCGFAAADHSATPRTSVIVPAHNNASDLVQCIAALNASASADTEIIVVDDASTDDTAAAARASGVHVIEMSRNAGPAAARNHGAALARGDVLMFVDADVVVAADALERVRRVFDGDPELAAVFGSYDASPRVQGVVSRYRNLLHHFTHQQANCAASTFWAGCGAVRREAFEAVGGFDGSRFDRPSIEDIDLGVRMRRAGLRIFLDKQLQATHLKRWTLRSMVATDIRRRAIPWSRLILETGQIPDDLNLRRGQRLSAALVGMLCMLVPLVLVWSQAILGALSILGAVIALNRGLFLFFFRRHGVGFALACVPLHLLYFLYSALSYLGVWVTLKLRLAVARSAR